MSIGIWDVILLLAVSAHATLLAYIHHPRLKALVYVLPIPFTLATLALGRPVGSSHALGLLLLPLYPNGVRWLHVNARLPIVAAIALTAGSYGVTGALLVRTVPATAITFWAALGCALAVAVSLELLLPHRDERGHRSPLPVFVKFTAVSGVIVCLVAAKHLLQGFMALFPMVGTVAAYEARKSLWTLGRQIPTQMTAMVFLLGVCRLVQRRAGVPVGLAAGWCVFLAVFIPLTRRMWRVAERRGGRDECEGRG